MILVATAAIAPLCAEPSVRSERVSELLLGETADVLAAEGSWRRIRTHDVGYEAWVHAGYVHELAAGAAAVWREGAWIVSADTVIAIGARRAIASGEAAPVIAVGEGAPVIARGEAAKQSGRAAPGNPIATGASRPRDDVGRPLSAHVGLPLGADMRLPIGARVAIDGDAVVLPDGRRGRLHSGSIQAPADRVRDASRLKPHHWALDTFGGAPYQWGGRTPWGVDCSGLVQATWAARGVQLPRDSGQQVNAGTVVPIEQARPGDLLFFRSDSGRDVITHIAVLAEDDSLVHSTIDLGGVVWEPWGPGTRAHALRDRLVAARRV